MSSLWKLTAERRVIQRLLSADAQLFIRAAKISLPLGNFRAGRALPFYCINHARKDGFFGTKIIVAITQQFFDVINSQARGRRQPFFKLSAVLCQLFDPQQQTGA